MFKRYELQATWLHETLGSKEPNWFHVGYRPSERALRKLYWIKVNLPQSSRYMRIYRMYDNRKNEVIT